MNEQERLQLLMQKEELNAKSFANEVGISAATMSNIIGGRNKPSLEVMQKVLNRFRTVNSDWLILGVGTMYRIKTDAQEQTLFDVKPELTDKNGPFGYADESQQGMQAAAVSPAATANPAVRPNDAKGKQPMVQIVERQVNKRVTKVVVFFEDGTFQEL